MELKAAKKTHWVRWRGKNLAPLEKKDIGCRERMQNVNNVKGISLHFDFGLALSIKFSIRKNNTYMMLLLLFSSIVHSSQGPNIVAPNNSTKNQR